MALVCIVFFYNLFSFISLYALFVASFFFFFLFLYTFFNIHKSQRWRRKKEPNKKKRQRTWGFPFTLFFYFYFFTLVGIFLSWIAGKTTLSIFFFQRWVLLSYICMYMFGWTTNAEGKRSGCGIVIPNSKSMHIQIWPQKIKINEKSCLFTNSWGFSISFFMSSFYSCFILKIKKQFFFFFTWFFFLNGLFNFFIVFKLENHTLISFYFTISYLGVLNFFLTDTLSYKKSYKLVQICENVS